MAQRKKLHRAAKDNKNKSKSFPSILMADHKGDGVRLDLANVTEFVTIQFNLDKVNPDEIQRSLNPYYIIKYRPDSVGQIPFINVPRAWHQEDGFRSMICNHVQDFANDIVGNPGNIGKLNHNYTHGFNGHFQAADYHIKFFLQDSQQKIQFIHVGHIRHQAKFTRGDNIEDLIQLINKAADENCTFNRHLPLKLVKC